MQPEEVCYLNGALQQPGEACEQCARKGMQPDEVCYLSQCDDDSTKQNHDTTKP